MTTGAAAGVGHHLAARVTGAGRSPGGTIEHWGAFFGDNNHADADMRLSPVPLNVPGPVAGIGTSNSTQYALLANGSVYA